MTGPRIRTPIAVLATAALVAMLATPASGRPAARVAPTRDTKIVKAMSASWSPSTIRISRNDTIKWKAVTGSHTVTAYGGNWQFNHSLELRQPGHPQVHQHRHVQVPVHVPFIAGGQHVHGDVREGRRFSLTTPSSVGDRRG